MPSNVKESEMPNIFFRNLNDRRAISSASSNLPFRSFQRQE